MKLLAILLSSLLLVACGGGNEPIASPPTPSIQANVASPVKKAATVTGGNGVVIDMYQALYGMAPSNALLLDYAFQANNDASTFVKNLTDHFATTSHADLAKLVLDNLGVTANSVPAVNASGQSEYALLLDAVKQIFAAYPTMRGQVILNMTNLLAGLEVDATYGAVAVNFNNQTLANIDYSAAVANTASKKIASTALNAISVIKTISTTVDYSSYGQSAYFYNSGLMIDLNNDGKKEFVFTATSYQTQVTMPLTVIGNRNGKINLTSEIFPSGVPTTKQAHLLIFQDISGDGKADLIVGNAGLDVPPWTGDKISVAFNDGSIFQDSTSLIPDTASTTTTRSYAIAVGDFNGDGKKEILLPDQSNVAKSVLLQYENGAFKVLPNPITNWLKDKLYSQTSMTVADFNGDGYDDLYIGGNGFSENSTILYGSKTGIDAATIKRLPPGPYGASGLAWLSTKHPSQPYYPTDKIIEGGDVNSISFDFNNDGMPDIFSITEQQHYYPPGVFTDKTAFQYATLVANGGIFYENSAHSLLINIDGKNFKSVIPSKDLGFTYYVNILAFDINNDGCTDVIGHYWTKSTRISGSIWNTTLFVNDCQGNFTVIDAVDVFPQLVQYPYNDGRKSVGAIIPIGNDASGFSGFQLLPEAGQKGKFLVQEFKANQVDRNMLH